MKPNNGSALSMKIYHNVHLALWATLAAFVVCFILFIAPKLPEAYAQAERLRMQEIAAEHESYCAKLRMGLGAEMHDQCILDLQEFRTKVENRIADEIDF